MTPEFTVPEVRELLRSLRQPVISESMFTWYTRNGILARTGKTKIRGRRRYSLVDLVVLVWVMEMTKAGVYLKMLKPVIPELRKRVPARLETFGNLYIVSAAGRVYVEEDMRNVDTSSALLNGHFIWAFNAGPLVARVKAAALKFVETNQTQTAS